MSKERLLVVDDEADFGAFVRRVAKKLDFEVEVTTQARDFKQIYKRFDPTVIVLDIVMPEVDGIELIQWLAAVRSLARIIIISGFDPHFSKAAEVLGKVQGIGSIVRLKKPVSVSDLESALIGRDDSKRSSGD